MTDIRAGEVDLLRKAMSGPVLEPGADGYDESRSIWNGAIDRRPAVIARCASANDVAAALAFAQQAGLDVSVRGGGHAFSGAALCDGGLTVDLTLLRAVTVDPARQVATCGGGVTWAELDAATQEHALGVPGGFVSHTGVAGLTLGGGLGWLTRLAGLSCDNLVGAEVVTADGRVVRASADDDAELLWGLKGGGGNFGVVTSFEFGLHAVGPMVHLGAFFFRPEQGREMFRFARDLMGGLPDESGSFLAGLNAPPEPFVPEQYHLEPVYAIIVVGLSDAESHARLIQPIRDSLSPLFELVTPIPYVGLQQMFNGSAVWGTWGYERALHLDELTDEAIDVIVEHQPRKRSPLSQLPIFVLGGAYGRVPDDSAAWGGSRSTRYVVNIAALAPTPELYEADREWVRAFWADLVPHANGIGSYVNFMVEYEQDRVRASYGPDKYARLAALKAKYDPGNLFRSNANIQPAPAAV